MISTDTCPQCGTAVERVDDNPISCPACGTDFSPAPGVAQPLIPPPPPVQSMIPPTPIPVAGPGMVLPYGELQQAATYLGMARTLRGIGIGNIIWGLILIGVGVAFTFFFGADAGKAATLAGLVAGIILGGCGLAFIAEGIWLIVAPSSTGLLVAAISMFVIGALTFPRILLTVILILYGIALVKRYKKYGPLMAHRPTPAMLAQAGEMLDKLQKAARKKTPELIEFSTADAFARRMWRGLLQDNLIVLIALESRLFGKAIAEVYFLPPSAINIDVTRKEFVGKWLKGTLYMSDQQFKGTIPPECYERFQAWRQRHQWTGVQ